MMIQRRTLGLAAAAAVLGLAPATLQAAPLGTAPGVLETGNPIARVDYQRCSGRGERRVCHTVRTSPPRGAGGASREPTGYYEMNADRLPYGTGTWWRQMERENRAGNRGG